MVKSDDVLDVEMIMQDIENYIKVRKTTHMQYRYFKKMVEDANLSV